MTTAAMVAQTDPARLNQHKRDQNPLIDVASQWPGSGLWLQSFNPGRRRQITVADFVKHLRQQAKACNFGFLYGMWHTKFQRFAKTDYQVDITIDEARAMREGFFRTYPGLERWHADTREFVREYGYVRALHGAKRTLPGIWSVDEGIQAECERQAINAPVQRFASDLGLIAFNRICRDAPMDIVKPVAFIHDALVFYVKDEYVRQAGQWIKWYMESAPLQEWF